MSMVVGLLVVGSLTAKAIAQEMTQPGPDWRSVVETATRVIPLYYVRDAEKVITLVRGMATQRSRATSLPPSEWLEKLAEDRRRLQSELAALRAQGAQPTPDPLALVGLAANAPPSTDQHSVKLERELARLDAQEQAARAEAFRAESQDASSQTPVVSEASDSPNVMDQVQITVIGEGRLHLRGPLEGVNAIAGMVHELDQPIGQVKIGIHVLQFSGSKNSGFEGVRGNLDRSLGSMRQMIQTSQMLFRTALNNVAARYQSSDPNRFEEAFFHGPCIRNYRKVNGQNAPLSIALLNSRDIVTTLFLTGLTTQKARGEILEEFQRLAAEELPRLHQQYKQAIASTREQEARVPAFLSRFSGSRASEDVDKPNATSQLDLSFTQTMSYFESFGDQPDAANAIQIATTRFQRAALGLRQAEATLAEMRNDRLLLAMVSSKRPPLLSLQPGSGELMDAASFGRLADHVIDQYSARLLDLREIVRAEVAALDGQLKRLATAFEDDLRRQFCKPVLEDLRQGSGSLNVQMGQIQTTTIRTNDRMLARASHRQVAVLDRAVRPVLLQEGLQVAYGLAQEAQSLSQSAGLQAASDAVAPGASPWLAATGLAPVPGQHLGEIVESSERTSVSVGDDIAVTPFIQPDGCSVAFHLVYAHTPERESEGTSNLPAGVKRHLIEADVQIPSMELQEVSRFRVNLDSDEQGRGIPLLEDVPGVGALFRPRRSVASTTQENIIIVDAVVYPTALSLVGKTWLALDSDESQPGDHPSTGLPSAMFDQGGLTGWVRQTLRRQAQATFPEAVDVQRIARPSALPPVR